MSAPWWGKEATDLARSRPVPQGAAPQVEPQLVGVVRDGVRREVLARAGSFAAEWTSRRPGDAGLALVKLFSEEMEPVLQRLNCLPQKSFVEFLRTAGVRPSPPIPAVALLQFTVADAAPHSVLVPSGFQVGASPAGGGDLVIFETDADLYAAPGKIQQLYVLDRGFYEAIDPTTDNVPFQPFGPKPRPGVAFFIGLSTDASVQFGPQLSIGIQVQQQDGQPAPVSTGGLLPLPVPLAPFLQWDVLDGGEYQRAAVIVDETSGLLQSGVVTVALPTTWRPGVPDGAPDSSALRWIRLQVQYGAYPQAPLLLSVRLNMVRATAVRTITSEVLTPLANNPAGGSVMSLSQVPVVPHSLILLVDDTADLSFVAGQPASVQPGSATAALAAARPWSEVDDLSEFGPEDEVFVLDSASGQVTFGDGTHGKRVPPGFRNVVAQQYQAGGGAAGAVAAGKVSNPVNSVPFVSSVQNPQPATGGLDAETQDQAELRGAREIRARGRAVAVADYEILALRTPGALVARAQAFAGFHPAFPGTQIPGVVGVFVVPAQRDSGAPVPDAETLRAVSTYLSGELAPAGVEVVAAAPQYRRLQVQLTLVIDPAFRRGQVVDAVLALLDAYFDPVIGGESGQGWPFGGTISYVALVRRLVVPTNGVIAVSNLRFIVAGVAGAPCSDYAIPAAALLWPGDHNLIALAPGERL
ncbi:putative baseplate assembly protein [Paraburkholderia sp. BR14374]|uniref:putative baseplate assembly protein n=1 Tax=Paraburkholderia sp. BR14374 TaxID=3237007 RepID=UPI0034CF9961